MVTRLQSPAAGRGLDTASLGEAGRHAMAEVMPRRTPMPGGGCAAAGGTFEVTLPLGGEQGGHMRVHADTS
jgi:hypothetical protein